MNLMLAMVAVWYLLTGIVVSVQHVIGSPDGTGRRITRRAGPRASFFVAAAMTMVLCWHWDGAL